MLYRDDRDLFLKDAPQDSGDVQMDLRDEFTPRKYYEPKDGLPTYLGYFHLFVRYLTGDWSVLDADVDLL